MNLKRAVFTVEAAVIVPLCAFIIAALIGYAYFEHEGVWSKAAAYESMFYAIQNIPDSSEDERIQERLEKRYDESVMGFAESHTSIANEKYSVEVKWEYGILTDVFNGLFDIENSADIKKVDPVTIKRLAH